MRTHLLAVALVASAMSLHADQADSLIETAKKAAAKNDFSVAEPNYNKALDVLDPADRRFASTAVEYATYLRRATMVEKALVALKKAADKQKAANVPAIGRTSILLTEAEVESQLRDAAALETVQTELVAVWTAAVGPDQPVVANNLVRLAQTLERNAKYAEAGQALDQALPILKKAFGPDDPSVGYALGGLTRIQVRTGKRDAAAETAKTAKSIMEKTLDPAAVVAGNGVSFPRITARKEPEYSEEAKKLKVQGTITLSIVVSPEGMPEKIHVLIPLGAGLDEKAVEAVKAWRFDPGKKNDDPVAVRATIDVNIRLL